VETACAMEGAAAWNGQAKTAAYVSEFGSLEGRMRRQ
jgi:hypothetical protein